VRLGAFAAILVVAPGCAAPGESAPADEQGWPVVYEQDFAGEKCLADFAFSDPSAWRRGEASGDPCLELSGPSAYEPPYRSPLSIALVDDLWLGDFALELEMCSTCREYPHRDLCLFFGVQSPGELRYAHLATAPDENAHNLFVVSGAPRARFTPVQTAGIVWGEDIWHRVRLERVGAKVEVWLDGTLVLQGNDPDPREGRIGVGSFDDTGRFRALRVFAPHGSATSPTRAFAL
jgi:hypothetical protein